MDSCNNPSELFDHVGLMGAKVILVPIRRLAGSKNMIRDPDNAFSNRADGLFMGVSRVPQTSFVASSPFGERVVAFPMLQQPLGDLNRCAVKIRVAFATLAREDFIRARGFTWIKSGKGFKGLGTPKPFDNLNASFS